MKHFYHKLTRLVQFFTYLSTSLGNDLIDNLDDLIYNRILNSPNDSEVSNYFLLEFVGGVRKVRDYVFESLLFLENMLEVCQNELSIDGSQISVDACL